MSLDSAKKIINSAVSDFSSYPNIHFYDDAKREAFWILEIASKEFGIDRLSANQISEILIEKFDISRSSRSIGSALGKSAGDGFVDKNVKTEEFKLMQKGRNELYLARTENPGVVYIEPGKPFNGKLILFSEILNKINNMAWICDAHIGNRLLELLHNLDQGVEIRIMTEKIHDTSFKTMFADFKKEHPYSDVRIAQKKTLHDRYVITDNNMWLIGHSLKDLGSRESFIVNLGEGIRNSLKDVFNQRWANCRQLI